MIQSSKTKPGLKFMIVDDEPAIAEVIRDELISCKFRAEMATCPKKALQRMKAEEFNGLVVDINMPEMNGIELAREMRAISLDIPVVFITGNVSEIARRQIETEKLGIIIEKPFHLPTLIQRLVEIAKH